MSIQERLYRGVGQASWPVPGDWTSVRAFFTAETNPFHHEFSAAEEAETIAATATNHVNCGAITLLVSAYSARGPRSSGTPASLPYSAKVSAALQWHENVQTR